MARWWIEYLDHDWNDIEQFDMLDPVVVLKHKDPSTLTCDLALGDTQVTRDIIAPGATDFVIYRGDTPILEGEVWEVSVAGETDILTVEHRDYLNYFGNEKNGRIYPFHYPFTYGDWPKRWVGEDLTTIAESILQAIIDEDPTNIFPIVMGNSLTGTVTNYQIDAGDATNALDHWKKLGDQDTGFDFWMRKDFTAGAVRFNILAPTNDAGDVIYTLTNMVGQIVPDSFQWKNTGPDSTWLLGTGAGAKNIADESTYAPSVSAYRRRDRVQDFGEVRNYSMLQRLTASEGFKERFPQKECSFDMIVDTAQLPNFWAKSLGRPRSLIGKRVHVGPINFRNYHIIDADFKVLDMTIKPDENGNDFVALGLDMING